MSRAELRAAQGEWHRSVRVAPAVQVNPRADHKSPWQSHIRKAKSPRTWRNVWGLLG